MEIHKVEVCGVAELALPGLLAAGAAGCDRSFAEFHGQTRSKLRRVLVRVLGSRPDIDDLLQEVYIKAWLNAGQFLEARGSVMAWLNAIARNVALDSFRRRSAQPIFLSACQYEDASPYEAIDSEQPRCDEAIDHRRACSAVRQCVDSLPIDRRRSVMLAFFCDLPHAEVARQSRIPLGTVKSHIRRSIESMRESMAPFCAV